MHICVCCKMWRFWMETCIFASPRTWKEETVSADKKTVHQSQKVSQWLYDSNPFGFVHYGQERMWHLEELLVAQQGKKSCWLQSPPEIGKLLQYQITKASRTFIWKPKRRHLSRSPLICACVCAHVDLFFNFTSICSIKVLSFDIPCILSLPPLR